MLTVKPEQATSVHLVVDQAGAEKQPELFLHDVELSSFSLRQTASHAIAIDQPLVDGLLLEGVEDSSVKHLSLERGNRHSLILSRTRDIAIEYVRLEDDSKSGGIVLRDATNTQTRGFTLPASSS